ncbi:Putative ribonuclease H protein At1g65750, partial [Linum perenne]
RANLLQWCRYLLTHRDAIKLGITCWYLWKSRNDFIFNNVANSAVMTASKIRSWVQTVQSALTSIPKIDGRSNNRERIDIAWEPGPTGWVTVNTDGSVLSHSGSSAAGGLIRSDSSYCLAAFSVNLGKCSITRAELRGTIIGLDLAWEAGHRKVAVQVDSRVVIDLLKATEQPSHQFAGEIHTLRQLLCREWETSFSHTYREGNKAADYLAGIGHKFPLGYHAIATTDCNLGFFLRHDCMGITEPRTITND